MEDIQPHLFEGDVKVFDSHRDLPSIGEPKVTYYLSSTKSWYVWETKGEFANTYVQLAIAPPWKWYPLNEVMDVIQSGGQDGTWKWYRNTACKYVELRIDMRDLKCLIRNAKGEFISLDQLKYQYTSESPEGGNNG